MKRRIQQKKAKLRSIFDLTIKLTEKNHFARYKKKKEQKKLLTSFLRHAHINVKTEREGGTGRGAAFDFFWQFFGQIPDPWDWKKVQS